MRISLLMVRSDTTIGLSVFKPRNASQSNLEMPILNAAFDELSSNDICMVYAMPRSQTLDEVLDDKDLAASIYKSVAVLADSSVDMRISILNEFGYKLRLGLFAAFINALVNTNKTLEGSTVVADVT